MRIETQFSIFLINKPGIMAAVTGALSEAGVNIYALCLNDSGEHGCLRIVCDQNEKTREVLRETHDRWTEADVVVHPIGNEPGAFSKIVQALADAKINITYAYCSAKKDGTGTTAIFKFIDPNAAIAALKDAGVV